MTMGKETWAKQLFRSIDERDAEAFLAFLSDDVLFRFGNADPVNGKTAVGEVVRDFFGSVKGMHHNLINVWDEKGVVICNGTVTYTRHDTTILTVPFANILTLDSDLIKEYLIYADVSELYKGA